MTLSSKELAYSLKTRANIYHTRSILIKHVEKAPRDWDGIELLIQEQANSNEELHAELTSYLRQELENNYKIVSLYKLDSQAAAGFKNLAKSVKPNLNLRYPQVLDRAQLTSMSKLHEVADSVTTEDYSQIVITRRREFALRKKIDRSTLAGDARAALTIYDEVYGVALFNWQNFDVLTLNHDTNLLEIRADLTRGESNYQNSTQMDLTLGEASGWLGLKFAEDKVKANIGKPLNLFPAINYFTKTADGLISKLCFRTPQGSVKQDTMKRGEDLRQENFYDGGLKAIGGNITPYDLSIIWHVENCFGKSELVELNIPSSLAVAASGDDASQTYAILRYCSTDSDTRLLVSKLLGAIPHDDKS